MASTMGIRKKFAYTLFALTVAFIAWRRQQKGGLPAGHALGLLFLNAVAIWCFHAYIYPHYLSVLRDVPLVAGYKYIGGHMLTSKEKGDFACDPSREWVEAARTDLVRFFDIRQVEHIAPISQEAMQELLATKCYDYEKPYFLKSGSNLAILGDGLLFAEGDMHKRQRKQMSPAFAFRHIKDLVPVFWPISAALVKAIEAQLDGSSGKAIIEPNGWTSRATLDIIGRAGLGKKVDALAAPDRGLAMAYKNLMELDTPVNNIFRLIEFVIPAEFLQALPLKAIKKFKANIIAIRETCRDMILEKQAMKKSSTGEGPTMDILSAMLSESEVAFTNQQLEEQLLTFVAAGHETTASALSWALMVLCKRPDVQRRLRDEVWSKLDASAWDDASSSSGASGAGAAVTAAQLANMPYLQAFCNEVLRVYPPIPMTIREAAVDTSLAGHAIPKGTAVVVPIWGTNSSTALWGPDAALFRPERWLESPSGGCKSNYALQTFLAGPRSCIGVNFAKHEFQCLVAAWVGRLETRFAPGQEEPRPHIIAGISAKPTAGWKVEVEVVERP